MSEIINHFDMIPDEDNTLNLGHSDKRWKDICLAGDLSDGTNARTVSEMVGLEDKLVDAYGDILTLSSSEGIGTLTLSGDSGVLGLQADSYVKIENFRACTDLSNANYISISCGGGSDSIAIGTESGGVTSDGTNSIAVGNGASSDGESSVAIGTATIADEESTIAIGNSATVSSGSSEAIAIGEGAVARSEGSIVIGSGAAGTAEGKSISAVAIGHNTDAFSDGSVSIGEAATVYESADGGIAIGNTATVNADHDYSIALGAYSLTTASNQLMIGESSTGTINSVVVGAAAYATLDFADIATTDKTFTFPNASGTIALVRSINAVSSTTSAGSTEATDYIYLCTGTFTITMPTAVGNSNRYTIKNVGSGTITIDTTSSQTIDGSLTATLPVQYTSLDLVSDNSNWNII